MFNLKIPNNFHSTGKTDFAPTIKKKKKEKRQLRRKYSIIESFTQCLSSFEFTQRATREGYERISGKKIQVEKSGTTRSSDTEIRREGDSRASTTVKFRSAKQ